MCMAATAVALAATAGGCASTGVRHHAYDGDERPDAELATVASTTELAVYKLDGQKLKRPSGMVLTSKYDPWEYAILPGPHTVTVGRKTEFGKSGSPTEHWQFEHDFRAGERWTFLEIRRDFGYGGEYVVMMVTLDGTRRVVEGRSVADLRATGRRGA